MGCKFRRQHGIGNCVVDFYCAENNLVIEIDGLTHDDLEVINRDREREKYLESQGLKVKRYGSQEIFDNPEGVVADIRNFCRGN